MHDSDDTLCARDRFPRGLTQPEGRFRFSIDALLLGCFASGNLSLKGGKGGKGAKENVVADLGAGCGAAGFAMLLHRPEAPLALHSLDIDPGMVSAAEQNAVNLQLGERCRSLEVDLKAVKQSSLPPESYSAVICNPPYRLPGSGRMPLSEERRQALFETAGALEDFIRAAAFLVKNKGQVFLVFHPERLVELFALLTKYRLATKRMRPVFGAPGEPSRIILVEARKNARPGMKMENGLILYSGNGANSSLTQDALAFCPFLRCNARADDEPEC